MSTGQANPNNSLQNTGRQSLIFVGDYGACDEGSYFQSTLAATASTAVANTTQALADTNPALAMYNGQAAGGYNIYLRYIKVLNTVVGGTNTTKNYSMLVDSLTNKLTTAGTALGTPVNTNSSSSTQSKMNGYGGVNIAAAQTAAGRRVGDGQVCGAVEVAFDQWIFTFGEPSSGGASLIGTATLVSARTIPCAPVILAPGFWFTLGFWGASQAAAANTVRWEIGYIERPSGQ